MTTEDLTILRDNVDKSVRLVCVDGEIINAKLISVSEEEQDIVFDMISTNREEKYEKLDRQPAYLLRFMHIAKVESVTLEGSIH